MSVVISLPAVNCCMIGHNAVTKGRYRGRRGSVTRERPEPVRYLAWAVGRRPPLGAGRPVDAVSDETDTHYRMLERRRIEGGQT